MWHNRREYKTLHECSLPVADELQFGQFEWCCFGRAQYWGRKLGLSYLSRRFNGWIVYEFIWLSRLFNRGFYNIICFISKDELSIASGTAKLKANSVWGALRGLETFSQLTELTEDHKVRFLLVNHKFWLIYIKPRFY